MAATRTERLRSLDAFRGIAIAGMILVNNPGSWRHSYAALRHAEWNGWTFADLIFPFFLFIVGMSITLSLGAARQRSASLPAVVLKILRRTAVIFALGLFLNGFPDFDWSVIRIPGVLQRIALCYLLASVVVLAVGVRGQAATAVALVVGYWVLMKYVPVPLAPEAGPQWNSSLAAYVDSALLHGHILHAHWDPEGVLSTLPATATTLAGVLAGHWLRKPGGGVERVVGFLLAGNVCIVVGLLMATWVPINKSLWSSSYVVFTAGIALNLFATCYWLIDVKRYTAWALPFLIYGMNPLLAYLLSSLMEKLMLLWTISGPGGTPITVKAYLFDHLFLALVSHTHASFLYALSYVLVWLGIMAIFYRYRIFIKI